MYGKLNEFIIINPVSVMFSSNWCYTLQFNLCIWRKSCKSFCSRRKILRQNKIRRKPERQTTKSKCRIFYFHFCICFRRLQTAKCRLMSVQIALQFIFASAKDSTEVSHKIQNSIFREKLIHSQQGRRNRWGTKARASSKFGQSKSEFFCNMKFSY